MKKLILAIVLLLVSSNLFAQNRLSGTAGGFDGSAGARYTKVNWEIYYDFVIVGNEVRINWTRPKITIPVDAQYASPARSDRSFTKVELGLAAWPTSNQHPYNLQVEVNISYPGGTTTSISDCGGRPAQCKSDFVAYLDPKKKYDVSAVKVVSSKFILFNGGGEIELDRIIANLKNKPTTAPAGIRSPATPNNNNEQINRNTSSSTATTPSSANKVNTNYVQTNTVQEEEQAQQIAEGLVSLFSGDPERAEARAKERREKLETEIEGEKYRKEWFESTSRAAQNGDVTAMVDLGVWYNTKNSKVFGVQINGGEDSKQAFYWFNKAANYGDVKALNYIYNIAMLGRGQKQSMFYVKYNLSDLDSFNALQRYVKYKNKLGTDFQYEAYKALAKKYKKGIGCEKNPTQAQYMEALYKRLDVSGFTLQKELEYSTLDETVQYINDQIIADGDEYNIVYIISAKIDGTIMFANRKGEKKSFNINQLVKVRREAHDIFFGDGGIIFSKIDSQGYSIRLLGLNRTGLNYYFKSEEMTIKICEAFAHLQSLCAPPK